MRRTTIIGAVLLVVTYTVSSRGAGRGVIDIALGDTVTSAGGFVVPLVLGIVTLVGALVGGILLIVLPGRAARRTPS